MSLRLRLFERGVPTRLKLKLLGELAHVTAEGFGCPPPEWSGREFEERLIDYACFTAAHAQRLLAQNDAAAADAARARLRSGAARLGAKLRRQLGLRRDDDALAVLALLYHHLGIEMTTAPDEIVVTQCLFATFFDERVCGLVAGLDEGMAAGLSGGGRLEFVERITGGSTCCRARFTAAERP
jgi:hypothetical protein